MLMSGSLNLSGSTSESNRIFCQNDRKAAVGFWLSSTISTINWIVCTVFIFTPVFAEFIPSESVCVGAVD